MKETFRIIEDLKRARVVEDYAVAGAVSDGFDSDRLLDLVHRFGLQEKWAQLEPLVDQE
jgi:hypothetical protein